MSTVPENDHSSTNASLHAGMGDDMYNISTVTAAYIHNRRPESAHAQIHRTHSDGEIYENADTTTSVNTSQSHNGHSEQHHTNKELAEHILHYISLTILSIFVVEVSSKCNILAWFPITISRVFGLIEYLRPIESP